MVGLPRGLKECKGVEGNGKGMEGLLRGWMDYQGMEVLAIKGMEGLTGKWMEGLARGWRDCQGDGGTGKGM